MTAVKIRALIHNAVVAVGHHAIRRSRTSAHGLVRLMVLCNLPRNRLAFLHGIAQTQLSAVKLDFGCITLSTMI